MNELEKSTADVQVFRNANFGEVRTSLISGNPYFCLRDVCRVLELDNPSQVRTRLDKKGIRSVDTLTAGGIQELNFINEPNLYRCIFQSRKENATAVQNWIFEEVIPSIRKTGVYGEIEQPLTKAEMRLLVFMDMQSEINRQSNVIARQSKRIRELKYQLESEKIARQEKAQKLLAEANKDNDASVELWLAESKMLSEVDKALSLRSLWAAYHAFCVANNLQVHNNKALSRLLRDKGYKLVRRCAGVYFKLK